MAQLDEVSVEFDCRFTDVERTGRGVVTYAAVEITITNESDRTLAIWNDRNNNEDVSTAVFGFEFQDAARRSLGTYCPDGKRRWYSRASVRPKNVVNNRITWGFVFDELDEKAEKQGHQVKWPIRYRMLLFRRAAIVPVDGFVDSDVAENHNDGPLPEVLAESDWKTLEKRPSFANNPENPAEFAKRGDVSVAFTGEFTKRIGDAKIGYRDFGDFRVVIKNESARDLTIWNDGGNNGDTSTAVFGCEWRDDEDRVLCVDCPPERFAGFREYSRANVAPGESIEKSVSYNFWWRWLDREAARKRIELKWPVKMRMVLFRRAAVVPEEGTEIDDIDEDHRRTIPEVLCESDWIEFAAPPDLTPEER